MLTACPSFALAQSYPDRPIRMVVTYAAGGPTDVLARALAERLSSELGQSVVIDNRGGGGGTIGYAAVATADPDGYTIAFADPSLTINPGFKKALPYDVARDFTPIATVVRGPTVLVASKASGFTKASDFVAFAKGNPKKLSYGSAGPGSPPHLNAEIFGIAQGIELTHVPYRGAAPAITDLIAGRIDIMFLNIGSAKAQIDSGALIPLAVSGDERLAKLPNVPTFREAGVPADQLSSGTWWGVIGPAKLAPAAKEKLESAIAATLRDPQLQSRYDAMNVIPYASNAEQFKKLMADELSKWSEVISRANISPE